MCQHEVVCIWFWEINAEIKNSVTFFFKWKAFIYLSSIYTLPAVCCLSVLTWQMALCPQTLTLLPHLQVGGPSSADFWDAEE